VEEQGGHPPPFALIVPDALLERLAERAAEIVLERLEVSAHTSRAPFLTVAEAADYLRGKPQRVYDLLSMGRLTRYKDGRRTLVSRAELDSHLAAVGERRVAPAWPPPLETRSGKGLAA
jgi:excisionase family DNA binding protein